MSEEPREQILSDFQDCTGLENMEECIQILQQHEWNLIEAIQAVHEGIGDGNDHESTVPVYQTIDDQMVLTGHNPSITRQPNSYDSDDVEIIGTVSAGARLQTTSDSARNLHFQVEYHDQTEHVHISENETVHKLREKVAEKVSVPVHQQDFLNWKMKSFDERTKLRDLRLPLENIIKLSSIRDDSAHRIYNHTTTSSHNSGEFPLTVLCEDKFGSTVPYKLLLEPYTTILEIKKHMENLARIPIHQQLWQGLLGATDSDALRQTQIVQNGTLVVRHSGTSPNQKLSTTRQNLSPSASTKNHDDDENMDTDHDIIVEDIEDNDIGVLPSTTSTTTVSEGREPLIPDEFTDEVFALQHFSSVFQSRYGSSGPILHMGSLDQALQESLYASIHSRRPLAIYLHNDQSICANVFCAQVLALDSTIEYLANNYVFWAWDVTSDVNRTRLLETLRRCVGNQCAQRVGCMEKNDFPLLLIVTRSRGLLELNSIIEGKSTPSEVLLNLIQSHDSFEQQRLHDMDEELMREKRENLKREQEDEYEQSRRADLAKQQAREQEERESKLRIEQRSQQQQESKARLPDEPDESEKNITRLKIRLPNDEGILMRRFRLQDNLQVLFDYLTSEGRMLGEYKLLTTFPKRDLTTLNSTDTFEQLKLYPQEQLILESL
ncbi:unnamed protein product [Adineta ricciae]|uniref:FAS-associated factor 1 n=1 Tax=Adineta ricciae TaxID=249248 RepID=A0A814GCH7_ADIRI|nr:unnamed protein product [Adineta ricciae]